MLERVDKKLVNTSVLLNIDNSEIKDIDKELYDKVVAEYHTEKELENRAKKDFERAIVEDLGFEPENINITKFKYRFEEEV